MRYRGELHCYHCGYAAASVEMREGTANGAVLLIPSTNGPGIQRIAGQPPRCGRCGGPLYLTEVEAVPKAISAAVVEAARPGRPRKVAQSA